MQLISLPSILSKPGVFFRIPAMLIILLTTGVSSYAQILSYTTATTGALNTVAANATGIALTRVNGLTVPSTPCGTGFSSTGFSSGTTYSSTLGAAEVSVSPSTGYGLNVTGFQADLRRSNTGPASLRFAYSVDGGTTWIDQGSNQANPSSSCGSGSTLSWATSFSVNAPSTLKFRIYGCNASSALGTEQILNLLINGTVATVSGCTPPSLSTVVINDSCHGAANGSIALTATGGSSPFTFLWSNSATTQNIRGLSSTTYSVTVTATGGCTVTTSASVGQPATLTANMSQTNTGCTNTGSATVTAGGGTSSYGYSWSNSQTTAGISNLAVGSYSVTITDALNCTATAAANIILGPPTGLTATNITNTSALLNWIAVAGATSYNIQYRKTGTTTWSTTTSATNSVSITGLTIATGYEFEVQVVCSVASTSGFSSTGNFATTGGGSTCSPPTVVSASNITTTTAKLNWNVVLGGLSYRVQYRQTGTTTWTTATSSTNSLSITGLTSGATYQFQVQTVCLSGPGFYSAMVSFTTGAPCPTPANLTITNITNTTALLNWGAVTGAGSYNIRYRKIGTTTWTTATSNTNSLSISGLTTATNYAFQVQTVCTGGTIGNFSTSGTFTTGSGAACSTPTTFTVTSITSTSALVSWATVTGAIRYNIQYRQTGTSTWISDTSSSPVYAISGLSPSVQYEFQAQTLCSGGSTSGFSASTTFTTLGPCGSPPSGFSVGNITMTTATLNWIAVTGASSYKVQYRVSGTSNWTSATSSTNSKTLSGLAAGTTYEFQVQIVCSGGTSSSFSASSLFSTSAALPRPDHVVVVIMENHSYSNIIGSSSAPYINSFLTDTNATVFNNSYAIEHPSQPNYLDFFSGSNQGVTTDAVPSNYPFTTANLARELIDSSLTFTTFSEDLPSVGFDGATSGNYARKHNPAANWVGSGTNQIASTTNQPYTAFPTSTNYASLPTVCYVVPNLNDDMHNGSISTGDTWLSTHIAPYVTWAETHNSLLILTWDEDDLSSSNQILTVFAGQMVKSGTDTSQITHYNVLRTIEDMYKLGHAGSAAAATPITNCWKQTQTGGSASVCDFSLWNHVYHSYRLIIHDTCTYVTGTVDHLIYEADGDIHIRVNVDAAFSSLLNSGNIANQYGDLVVEPICATTVTQADAVSACAGFTNTVYIPNVGEHVKVTGSYVTDNDHGWNEIHPITSIVITTQTSQPSRAGAYSGDNDVIDDDFIGVNIFPNPSTEFLNFKIGKRQGELVQLEIMDELGRSAGQYQLQATSELQITTTYLPAGVYYYNLKQNSRVMNSGKFVVVH